MHIEVRVQPKAKRNKIEVVDGAKLKVYVTAAPESGKANDAVVALLAKALGVSKSSISVMRGHKARDKVMRLDSLSADEVYTRLAND